MEQLTEYGIKEMREQVYYLQKQIIEATQLVRSIKTDLQVIHKAKPEVFLKCYEYVKADIQTVYGVDITENRRKPNVVAYRACVMHTMLEMFDMSLSEVGLLVGKKDHSTVIHARKNVDNFLSINDPLYTAVKRNVVEIFNNYF